MSAEGQNVTIGFAKADISRCVKSDAGSRRPLEAVCAVVARKGLRSAIISCDLMEISPRFNAMLQETVAKALETHPDNVLIHTTHTHTSSEKGSDFSSLLGLETVLAQCAKDAAGAAESANMKAGTADAGTRLNMNRRGNAGDDLGLQTFWYGYRYDKATDRSDASQLMDEMRQRWRGRQPDAETVNEPIWFDGPVDPHVHAMLFSDSSGKSIGSIVRFCAHPHIASACRNRLQDPDFPARVRDEMESRHGGICMFLSGPLANMVPKEHIEYAFDDPAPRRDVYLGASASLHPKSDTDSLREMERIGREIAQAATEALDREQWSPVTEFAYAAGRFPVELEPALPENRAQGAALGKLLEAEYHAILRSGGRLREVRPVANMLNWLVYEAGHWDDTITPEEKRSGSVDMPLAALALNGKVMVFLHSEIAIETTAALKEEHRGVDLWTVNLTGGTLNYLPPDYFMDEGGYEGKCVLVKRGSEAGIRSDIAKLLKDLVGEMDPHSTEKP